MRSYLVSVSSSPLRVQPREELEIGIFRDILLPKPHRNYWFLRLVDRQVGLSTGRAIRMGKWDGRGWNGDWKQLKAWKHLFHPH